MAPRTRLVNADELHRNDRIWWEGDAAPVLVRRVTHHHGYTTVLWRALDGGAEEVDTVRWDDLVALVMGEGEEREDEW